MDELLLQNEPDLDEAVRKITENHVYIAVVTSDSSIQVHLTAERCLFGKAKSPINLIVSLIGAYFAFDIAYPKALYQLCIFIQHFVLRIVDKQKVPEIVKRTLASLDNIKH